MPNEINSNQATEEILMKVWDKNPKLVRTITDIYETHEDGLWQEELGELYKDLTCKIQVMRTKIKSVIKCLKTASYIFTGCEIETLMSLNMQDEKESQRAIKTCVRALKRNLENRTNISSEDARDYFIGYIYPEQMQNNKSYQIDNEFILHEITDFAYNEPENKHGCWSIKLDTKKDI